MVEYQREHFGSDQVGRSKSEVTWAWLIGGPADGQTMPLSTSHVPHIDLPYKRLESEDTYSVETLRYIAKQLVLPVNQGPLIVYMWDELTTRGGMIRALGMNIIDMARRIEERENNV